MQVETSFFHYPENNKKSNSHTSYCMLFYLKERDLERGVNVKVYAVPEGCTMLKVLFSLQRFYFYNTEAAVKFNR